MTTAVERILTAKIETIAQYVEEALTTDGEHHKQWYLERLADELHLPHEKEGIAP